MINPAWLLPLTLLFCSVLSVVTGTSYGSVGSAGVAMMAIGNAMGINSGMVAGAVICGAMFGDKLSPLSDTTNLAPAVSGAKLGDHIRACFGQRFLHISLVNYLYCFRNPADKRWLYSRRYFKLYYRIKWRIPSWSGNINSCNLNYRAFTL